MSFSLHVKKILWGGVFSLQHMSTLMAAESHDVSPDRKGGTIVPCGRGEAGRAVVALPLPGSHSSGSTMVSNSEAPEVRESSGCAVFHFRSIVSSAIGHCVTRVCMLL